MSSTESTKAVQKRAKFCLEVLWLAWQYRLGKTKCKYFNNQNYNFRALSQWMMDRNKRKLNCFYSIFAKKRNSHGHFLYLENHKIIRYYKWRGGGWLVQNFYKVENVNEERQVVKKKPKLVNVFNEQPLSWEPPVFLH